MTITLEARTPCLLCGYQIRCLAFPSVRITKRSLRQQRGNYLRWGPGLCEECGTDNFHVRATVRYQLHPESVTEVEEYRTQRWPELAAAS
jgi:hypothetical protein